MIAAISNIWAWTPQTTRTEVRPSPPKPYRAPLLIGDVALPRGQSTEFHHQWRRAEEDPQGPDEAAPYK